MHFGSLGVCWEFLCVKTNQIAWESYKLTNSSSDLDQNKLDEVTSVSNFISCSPCSDFDDCPVRHPGQLFARAARWIFECGGAVHYFSSGLCRLRDHHLEAAGEQRGSHLQGNFPFFGSTGRCCFWDWLDAFGACCYNVIWESVLSLVSVVSLRFLFFPGCPCSVFSSTSTSWCSWTWVHGAASPSGWLWVRSSTTHPVLTSIAPH